FGDRLDNRRAPRLRVAPDEPERNKEDEHDRADGTLPHDDSLAEDSKIGQRSNRIAAGKSIPPKVADFSRRGRFLSRFPRRSCAFCLLLSAKPSTYPKRVT